VTNSSSTDFSASDGRRFAFPVGVAFLLLSGVLLWREKDTAFPIIAGIGAVLLVAGAIAPARLGPLYRAWMRMALVISRVTTPIFLGVVYFAVLTPTGLLMRLFGKRPTVHALEEQSYWRRTASTRSDLNRQF
jgi:Saxitoxin biosynthesis operon protein SxtJ